MSFAIGEANDWRILSRIPGVVLILPAETTVFVTRYLGVSHTTVLMCPQNEKFSGLLSGERGVQPEGPLYLIHCAGRVVLRTVLRSVIKKNALRHNRGKIYVSLDGELKKLQ